MDKDEFELGISVDVAMLEQAMNMVSGLVLTDQGVMDLLIVLSEMSHADIVPAWWPSVFVMAIDTAEQRGLVESRYE